MEIFRFMAVVSCIGILIGIWEFLKWGWFTPKKLEKKLKAQGFKGHPYRFLFGDFKKSIINDEETKSMNLYDDNFTSRLMGVFGERIREYGKYTYVWSGPTPVVTLTDPELVKEVTFKNYHFPKAPHNPLSKLLMKGIQGLEGEKWSKHRKIISPAFHVEKLKLMIPTFYTTINEIVTEWEEIVTSSNGSSEIDVWPYLQRLTSDVISRTAFGSNYEEGKAIFELQKEQSQYFIKVVMSVYIPGWRFVPTKMHRRMKEISKLVNKKIRCIVEGRMKAMKAGEAYGDDFLGLLLESNLKEINEGGSKEFGLSIEDVIEECKVLYFAGQETTSVLLVWTMILLGRHPEWQNRAREEVLQLFSDQQIPDYTVLNHLKIVTMILNEVLRLYSPVTGMRRIAMEEETKLGDFTLPAGVVLQIPTILIHRDPEVWGDDANEFKPERFADGVANATNKTHRHNHNQQQQQLSFLPFSWGPRVCMGQNFAMTEARMAIAMILQRFSIEVSPSYAHYPHQTSLTLQPKYGAQLILHKL